LETYFYQFLSGKDTRIREFFCRSDALRAILTPFFAKFLDFFDPKKTTF